MQAQAIERFIAAYNEYLEGKEREAESASERIHVDEVASRLATFYEKIRNLIDYREEHLLRKNTIERILRRRIFLKDLRSHFAEPLIKELIRSGYLRNDAVSESAIGEVQIIIDNLIFLLHHGVFKDDREKKRVLDWLINITVPAIEEELFPPTKDRVLSDLMFDVLRDGLTVKNSEASEKEKDVQLFIAVQRTLFRPDEDQLHCRLLKFARPNWGKSSREELEHIAKNLPELRHNVETLLESPLTPYFFKLCNKEKILFLLLGDIVFSGKSLAENFEEELQEAYRARYKREKIQLHKLAFLSVISFFISKILVAVAIEIPLDTYLSHSFSLRNLIINITLPPFLMLVIAASIKLPSKKNYYLVETRARQVVFPDEQKKYVVAVPKKRGWASELFVRLAYLVTLVLTLYVLVRLLLRLDFSVASIFIFALFASMVIATGVKINNRSKEISLEKEKGTIVGFLIDLVAIPFMTIGKWAIAGLTRFNVLVIAFNFLIELPFQLFIEFLENFRGFIRAKKEEVD